MSRNFFDVNLIVDERLLIKDDQRLVVLFRKTVLRDLANLMIKLNRSLLKENELNELDDLIIEDLLYCYENRLRELDDLTIEA